MSEKRLLFPVFEGTAALRQLCCSDDLCECGGRSQSFEKGWFGEDEEMAEMAALVPEWFRTEMSNKNNNVIAICTCCFLARRAKSNSNRGGEVVAIVLV